MAENEINALPAFDLEGHRGCRGLMPENTIPAYLKALDLGVTTLEMDAVITRDGQVIMSHEPFFNHQITTGAEGREISKEQERSLNIYQMTYAETQEFDVGLKFNPAFPDQQKMAAQKPLLADVIDSVRSYCETHQLEMPFFNIETKCTLATDDVFHPAPAVFVDLIMKVVEEKGIREKTIIQSFDFRTLRYLHEKYPDVKASALVEDYDILTIDGQVALLGFLPTIYSPAKELVTPELVAACKSKGIKLIPWTVNDITEMIRLKEMGVDGLISDYPDRFKNIPAQ